MDDLGLAALSVLVLAVAMLLQPARAACPHGWVQAGVDRAGAFSCVHELVGRDWDPKAYRPAGTVYGRIYCSGGTVPLQVDERTVGCGRGRYQWQ